MKVLSLYKTYQYQPQKFKKQIQSENEAKTVSKNFCYGYYMPIFTAGKVTDLAYIVEKLPEKLPKRVLEEAKKVCKSKTEKTLTLEELHNRVYQPLMQAKSLEEVKKLYLEFKDVKELGELERNSKTKTLDFLVNLGVEKSFTLDILKLLYKPLTLEEIGRHYGGIKRKALEYLLEKLNIPKLSSHYQRLYALSNPTENNRYGSKFVETQKKQPEVFKKAVEKSVRTHKSDAYRAKKSQEIKDYIRRNPDSRKMFGLISKKAWENSSDIKEAMALHREKQSQKIKAILSKEFMGEALTRSEKILFASYFKSFWEANPDLKALFKQRIKEARESMIS